MSKSIYDEAIEDLYYVIPIGYPKDMIGKTIQTKRLLEFVKQAQRKNRLLELYKKLDDLIVSPDGHHVCRYTDDDKILYEGNCFPLETFTGRGKVEDIEVSCIEPYSQVMFHLGYEFDENDMHDVKLLCETFHIEIPDAYR